MSREYYFEAQVKKSCLHSILCDDFLLEAQTWVWASHIISCVKPFFNRLIQILNLVWRMFFQLIMCESTSKRTFIFQECNFSTKKNKRGLDFLSPCKRFITLKMSKNITKKRFSHHYHVPISSLCQCHFIFLWNRVFSRNVENGTWISAEIPKFVLHL